MKHRVAIIALTVAIVGSGALWANAGAHGQSVEEVEAEIRSQLEIGPGERINPDAVPAPLLEELGEAVMSELHPNEEEHSWMDRMMGGEGSASLASAHRWMGYNYLVSGYPARGVMGGWGGRGMMHGRGMMGRGPAVDNYEYGDAYASPEEILKRRYARGEITSEEYNRMLEELRK